MGVTIMGEQGKAPRVGIALHLDHGAGLTVRGRCTLSKRVCLKPEEPGLGSEDYTHVILVLLGSHDHVRVTTEETGYPRPHYYTCNLLGSHDHFRWRVEAEDSTNISSTSVGNRAAALLVRPQTQTGQHLKAAPRDLTGSCSQCLLPPKKKRGKIKQTNNPDVEPLDRLGVPP